MPTTRARHILTETDDVSAAIDAAAPLFPDHNRADLLRELVRLGAAAIADQQAARRSLVADRAGRYAGLFPDRYLDSLRDEWPQ